MLTITANAEAALREFHDVELLDGEFIRISRAYQCGASRFQVLVDDVRTAMDAPLRTASGVELIVEESCLNLLDGCELDFNEDGFMFKDDLGRSC